MSKCIPKQTPHSSSLSKSISKRSPVKIFPLNIQLTSLSKSINKKNPCHNLSPKITCNEVPSQNLFQNRPLKESLIENVNGHAPVPALVSPSAASQSARGQRMAAAAAPAGRALCATPSQGASRHQVGRKRPNPPGPIFEQSLPLSGAKQKRKTCIKVNPAVHLNPCTRENYTAINSRPITFSLSGLN